MAIAGGLGLEIELARVPCLANGDRAVLRNDVVLYSESGGRLVVTVPRRQTAAFEARLAGHVTSAIGLVVDHQRLLVMGLTGAGIIDVPIETLWRAWKQPFGQSV